MKTCLINAFLVLILIVCSMLFGGCNLRPTLNDKGVTLGASVFTKSSSEYAKVTRPDGTKIEYARTDGDEVSGASTIAGIWSATAISKNLADNVTKQNVTNNVTTRQVTGMKESTKVIKGAQDVEKLRILNPVVQ